MSLAVQYTEVSKHVLKETLCAPYSHADAPSPHFFPLLLQVIVADNQVIDLWSWKAHFRFYSASFVHLPRSIGYCSLPSPFSLFPFPSLSFKSDVGVPDTMSLCGYCCSNVRWIGWPLLWRAIECEDGLARLVGMSEFDHDEYCLRLVTVDQPSQTASYLSSCP